MSWEQLTALSAAHRREKAETLLMLTIAAQGDDKSWKNQIAELKKMIHA